MWLVFVDLPKGYEDEREAPPVRGNPLLSSSFDYIIVFVSVIRKSSIIKIFSCGDHHDILRLFTAILFPTPHWQLTWLYFCGHFSLTHTYTLMHCNKSYLLCANSYMEIWLLADQVYLLLPVKWFATVWQS